MSKQMLEPCPLCGSSDIDAAFAKWGDGAVSPGCMSCGATANTQSDWNDRASPQSSAVSAMAWLSMSTAPRDRVPVLLKVKDRIPSDREDLRRWDGLIFVGRNYGDIQDWGFAAPVGVGGFPDEWFDGWNHICAQPQAASMASDDPTASKEWNDGCDFAMTQLCKFLDVEPSSVSWDAATDTVEGDVSAVIGNILRAKFGEDWGPQCQAVSDEGKP